MTAAEIRRFKVELLDDVNDLAHEPVPDPDNLRQKVEDSFKQLEDNIGEKR